MERKKVTYDIEHEMFDLEDGKMYGIDLTSLRRETVSLNPLISKIPIEIDPSNLDEQLKQVLEERKELETKDEEVLGNQVNYAIIPRDIEFPIQGIIKCIYNKKRQVFIEPTTKIEFPLGGGMSENTLMYFDAAYDYRCFRYFLKDSLIHPIIALGDDEENGFYEYDESLDSECVNEEIMPFIIKKMEEVKQQIKEQHQTLPLIDQEIAEVENIKLYTR